MISRRAFARVAAIERRTLTLYPLRFALVVCCLITGLIAAIACECYGQETPRELAALSSPAVGPWRTQLRGLGMVVKLGRSPTLDDQQIALMRTLGVSVAVWPPGEWAENEKLPGQYAFPPEVRRVLRNLAAANIKLIVVLFRKNSLYPNPLDADAFAKYCAWIVTATKDQPVAAYQIWNEPSNFDFRESYGGAWNGVGDAPWLHNFVEVLGKAARAIKQTNPRATVLVNLEGPPLAFALRASPQEFADIDGVSIHPYSAKFPAEQVPWGGIKNFVRDGVAVADSAGSLVSSIQYQADSIPRQYLGRTLQTWITEYGFPTCDPAAHPEHFNCVSPLAQAAFHARGMLTGFGNGARVWSVYELADEGANWSDPEQNFGIAESAAKGYAPKPAFLTLQRIARILGTGWIYLPEPPATLVAADGVGLPRRGAAASSIATVSGPQMVWFSTARGYAGFIWRAGPYDDVTINARITLGAALPASPLVLATDVVTGQTLSIATGHEPGALTIDHLPLGSRPMAIELIGR